ncbi:MAG: hypothetical protein LBK46_08640 [Oscillospiraceae bacterium]|jgi:phenylpyruvate tautomerase PptA (4-oxalocrotonate tautomerase family)|nr:hypothetical protein [Oscillospiraceae bacterium]
MPFISITTSQVLTYQDKQCLASEAGRLISLIAGKSEEQLMVKVDSDVYMKFRGKEDPCAYIDLHVYTAASFDDKKSFAEEFMKSAAAIIGIPTSAIFITVTEHEEWGSGDTYRQAV